MKDNRMISNGQYWKMNLWVGISSQTVWYVEGRVVNLAYDESKKNLCGSMVVNTFPMNDY